MATGHTETTGSTDTTGVNVEDYFDKVIKKVSYKWDDLARKLKFERGEIEAIRATESLQGPDKKCREVLERWQNRNGANATLQVLQQALIDIEERRTAEELHGWSTSSGAHRRSSTRLQSFLHSVLCHKNVEAMPPNIKKLCKYLRQQYRSKLGRINPLPWCEDLYLDLEDMFTTLEMVHRDGLKKDTPVTVEDMFQSYNDCVPQTIRVEGDPGIGKTTLCYKIAYCSAKKSNNKLNISNTFSSFNLVLYVAMHNVAHDATDLKSTIFQQTFALNHLKHEEEFWDYVEDNPEDVLFVLDGLDEMPEETREKLKIAEFIKGKTIGNIHVVVTSRPYLCNKQLNFCDRHFVIKGFSNENIESYIEKHGKLDSNLKEGMLKQLNENDSLNELTRNPLNLALLCMLWKEEWNNGALPQTLTGLYSLLVLAIVEKYALRYLKSGFISVCFEDINQSVNVIDCLRKLPEEILKTINDLNVLAWTGIEDNHWYFPGIKCKGLEKLGFLRKDLLLTTNSNNPLSTATTFNCYWFEFLHRTFQEYFAAMNMYMSLQGLCFTTGTCTCTNKHSPSTKHQHDMRTRLKEYIQNDRYHQVIKFLAGLLGTNACCLFEAFHDCLSPEVKQDEIIHNSLSRNQDERIISLCLECLHECGAGTELVKIVSDVLPRDWHVGSDTGEQEVKENDEFSHIYSVRLNPYMTQHEMSLPYRFGKDCFGMCILSLKCDQTQLKQLKCDTHFIRSNDALYGLVPLLQYRAKANYGQDLSNVKLRPGLESATCRFLRAILDTKGIGFLAINIAHHGNELINEVCNLLKSDAYKNLSCNVSMCPCDSSSLDQLSKVLSSVQTTTGLSLYTSVNLRESFDSTNQWTLQHKLSEVVNTTVFGTNSFTDKTASVQLYIDCANDTYIPDLKFVASSIANLVTNIKGYQKTLCISPQGSMELLFIVRNLPVMEKETLTESTLDDISLILQDSCCILSTMTFECSCENGSVLSTIPLLQSLALNQSLTQVSLLCDDPDNVARCLREIFSKNRILQKLEIGFLYPVEDEAMANIFSSFSVDSTCHIESFSVVMGTGTYSSLNGSGYHSYEQTVRAILYICKNLCDGSALQEIAFISGPGKIMTTTEATISMGTKVRTVCPAPCLLQPLIEAIVDSQLSICLPGMVWEDVTNLKATLLHEGVEKYLKSQNFQNSNLGRADTGVHIAQLFGQYMHSPLELYSRQATFASKCSKFEPSPISCNNGLFQK